MAAAKETADKKISGGVIAPCTCKHDFQDKEYGKGQRYHVKTRAGKKCTVCGRAS